MKEIEGSISVYLEEASQAFEITNAFYLCHLVFLLHYVWEVKLWEGDPFSWVGS